MAIDHIRVGLDFGNGNKRDVGLLAYTKDRRIFFEYSEDFLNDPLPISPFHLPVKRGELGPFELNVDQIKGLPGVFYDSLPDGWGRLLLDRFAESQGIEKQTLSPLDRLAYVGNTGMGALVYKPDYVGKDEKTSQEIDLRKLAQEVQEVLDGSPETVLSDLLHLNGSSHGARPKAMVDLNSKTGRMCHGSPHLVADYERWIVKFPNQSDQKDAGAEEYIYSLMAREAGIEMPQTLLFRPKSEKHSGFFAIKRFDSVQDRRLHLHSAAGLLNMNFREDFLDYKDIFALAFRLTNRLQEVEKLYRIAVFNVLAHNQDDHAKNFSFLMNEQGEWAVSPAYDLTYSSGRGGYQSSSVLGKSYNLQEEDLLKLGQAFGLPDLTLQGILERTKEALLKWPVMAKDYGISQKRLVEIQKKICR